MRPEFEQEIIRYIKNLFELSKIFIRLHKQDAQMYADERIATQR